MEFTTIAIAGIITLVAIVYFSSTLKRIASLGDTTVDTGIVVAETALDLMDDTIGTYKHEVKLSNAEKRSELMDKYSNIGQIVSVNELDSLLADKQTEPETA